MGTLITQTTADTQMRGDTAKQNQPNLLKISLWSRTKNNGGMAFQNPKAWVVALTVVTVFFPNEENFVKATLFVSLSAPLMCFFSVITWAGFGSSIRVFISNEKIKKFIEVSMALLLAVTAVFMLI